MGWVVAGAGALVVLVTGADLVGLAAIGAGVLMSRSSDKS